MDDHRRSLAKPNYSPDVGHASPQGKPKQEQEQEQSKSKPALFLTCVDMARRFSFVLCRSFLSIEFIPILSQKMKHKGDRRKNKVRL